MRTPWSEDATPSRGMAYARLASRLPLLYVRDRNWQTRMCMWMWHAACAETGRVESAEQSQNRLGATEPK